MTEGPISSKRLHVRDRKSGNIFLVDSGAEISLLPAPAKHNLRPSGNKLYAANDTIIETYDSVHLKLDLGIRRPISWNFCVAAVPFAIIGADLISHYNLLIDLKRRRLVDQLTGLYTSGVLKSTSVFSAHLVNPKLKYAQLIADFPKVIGAEPAIPLESRDVYHHIVTTGPPVAERARRLAPDKLKAAKAQFK